MGSWPRFIPLIQNQTTCIPTDFMQKTMEHRNKNNFLILLCSVCCKCRSNTAGSLPGVILELRELQELPSRKVRHSSCTGLWCNQRSAGFHGLLLILVQEEMWSLWHDWSLQVSQNIEEKFKVGTFGGPLELPESLQEL